MLEYLAKNWNVVAAVVGGIVLLVVLFWPTISKLRLPGGGTAKSSGTIKSDLDAALGLLQRAKERAAVRTVLNGTTVDTNPGSPLAAATADAVSHAVESLVKELTA